MAAPLRRTEAKAFFGKTLVWAKNEVCCSILQRSNRGLLYSLTALFALLPVLQPVAKHPAYLRVNSLTLITVLSCSK